MAKKVSKTSTKKKTTKKSSASSKKKTSSGPSRAAKKTTSKKATTAKKVAKKPSTKKNVTKATTKKSPKTSTKKTTKKVGKKSSSKKTTKKAPASKKTPVSKKAPVTKKTTTKKSTTKKAPASSSKKKTTKKADASTTKKSSKKSKRGAVIDGPRFRGAFASSHNEGLEAAKRLASAAGLSGISRASQVAEEKKKYRRVTKSPFNADQLAEFRDMLRTKRRQIVGDVSSMETEALSSSDSSSHTPNHMADQGSDTYDQSLNLDLAASQRTLLTDIDDALMRIESGTYGICELLGKPVKAERLRNTPWARFSIEAARMIEDDPSILRRSSNSDDSDD